MSSRVHSNSYSNHRSSRPSFSRQLRNRCSLCIRIFKWLPVLFIVSVLCWGYYAYVIQLNLFNINSVILKTLYLSVFHVIYVLTMWSYWQTIFTESAHIPRDFWLPPTEREKLLQETNEENQRRILDHYVAERNLPIQCRAYNGMYRICENCFMIKPDRAHHCSVCDQCVLKMDHHCPWVNNCVSFSNYKFFILFLGYAFVLCLFSAMTSFPYFLKFWKNELSEWGKFHILFLFFVSIMFAISLISLFGYHIYLVLLNRSTLESFRAPVFGAGPDRNAYNLGKQKNFCQVFGDNKLYWFLPIYTSIGDGIIYETRAQLPAEHRSQQSFYNSIGQSDTITVPIETQQHTQSDDSKGSGIVFDQKNYCEDNDKLLNGDDGEEEAIIARTASSGPKLTEVPTELTFTSSRLNGDNNSSHYIIDS